MVKFLYALACLLLLSVGSAWTAEIDVRSDRNVIQENESFQLIFTAAETPDADPDFRPLEEDFEIVGRSQSSNISVINGKVAKSVTWTLSMMARKTGRLTVPAISFGSDLSRPITLTIKSAGTGNTSKTHTEEVILETEATPKNPYVQSQVIYTVRVLHAVNISEARLTEPQLNDAVIEKLGEDIQYNTRRDGTAYSAIERKYAIFPQKSGTITIDPLTLTAQVVTGRSSGSMFDGFFRRGFTRSQRVQSNPVRLNVEPIPQSFGGKHWLAAEKVELTEAFPEDSQKVIAGEPITRTLSLKVWGNTVGQLPDLSELISPTTSADGGKIKVYPDQPALNENTTLDGIVSYREEKTALIPSREGRYTLPAIEIPWWNTDEDKMEIARIPERVIEVLPSASAESAETKNQTAEKLQQSAESPPSLLKPTGLSKSQPANWIWALLGLAIGWASALLVWWLRRNRKPPGGVPDSIPAANRKIAAKAVLQACRQNNPKQAREAILDWAKTRWPAISASNLEEVTKRCDIELRSEINRLNQVMYGKDAESWEGESLSNAFQAMQAKTPSTSKDSSIQLEPLYKT